MNCAPFSSLFRAFTARAICLASSRFVLNALGSICRSSVFTPGSPARARPPFIVCLLLFSSSRDVSIGRILPILLSLVPVAPQWGIFPPSVRNSNLLQSEHVHNLSLAEICHNHSEDAV